MEHVAPLLCRPRCTDGIKGKGVTPCQLALVLVAETIKTRITNFIWRFPYETNNEEGNGAGTCSLTTRLVPGRATRTFKRLNSLFNERGVFGSQLLHIVLAKLTINLIK